MISSTRSFLFLTAASYTVNPAVYKLSFDPIKDVTPIAQLARGPFIIAVNPTVKANTLKELVELARKSPDALSYAERARRYRARKRARHAELKDDSRPLSSKVIDLSALAAWKRK